MMRKRVIVGAMVCVLVAVGCGAQIWFARQARMSPGWKFAARALARTAPDYDLRWYVDLEPKDRKDFTHGTWKPMPCINTATANYNPRHRAGNCARFVREPSRWGFREISASEARAEDLIIFLKNGSYPRHAGVFVMNSLIGPLCATTAYPRGGYYHYFPFWPVLKFTSFSVAKYYRYEPEQHCN